MSNIIHHYKQRSLNKSPKCQNGFHLEILDRIEDLISYMKHNHGKVFYAGMLLRFPNGYVSNSHDEMRNFLDEFRKAIERKVRANGKSRINTNLKYIWKSERDLYSPNQHYHIIFACNAAAWWNLNGFLRTATEYWNKAVEMSPAHCNFGLVHSPGQDKINGTTLSRNNLAKENELFEWFSYNAKVMTSDPLLRKFDSSQGLKNFSYVNSQTL